MVSPIVLERHKEEVTLSLPCKQPVLPDPALRASLGPQPLKLPRDPSSIQLVAGLAPCTREEGSIPAHLALQVEDWRTSSQAVPLPAVPLLVKDYEKQKVKGLNTA